MSTATLNVWITEFSDPCRIMGPHVEPGTKTLEQWYVHIVDCAGKPLTWCGKTYTFMQAKCGHLEVEIPPGCYAVFASHTSPAAIWVPPFGNRLTHIQVVRANCGDHVCVTLFSPELWYCGTWFAHALETQVATLGTAKIDAKLVTAATGAIHAVLAQIKPTDFAANLEAFKKDAPRAG
jgi:hypothetical protein